MGGADESPIPMETFVRAVAYCCLAGSPTALLDADFDTQVMPSHENILIISQFCLQLRKQYLVRNSYQVPGIYLLEGNRHPTHLVCAQVVTMESVEAGDKKVYCR